jgi:hypothetical protein
MSEENRVRVGWGIQLAGEAFDLEDWQRSLKPPFDPWIVETEHGMVLRSRLLDAATSSTEARDQAESVMGLMNGLFAVTHRARTLRLENVVEFFEDGSQRRHVFAHLGATELRCKVRAEAVVLDAQGNPRPPPTPKPTDAQRWSNLAADDDLLADTLTYFGRGDDWFDIYKALECLIIRFAGGTDATFLKLGWAAKSEIELLKRTANYERHARRKFDPPPNPMPRATARELLGLLIARALVEVEGKANPTVESVSH